MKLVDFFAAYDGVAGICPTLIADNDVMFWSQKVYEFTFGFITPLQTDYASRWHKNASLKKWLGKGLESMPQGQNASRVTRLTAAVTRLPSTVIRDHLRSMFRRFGGISNTGILLGFRSIAPSKPGNKEYLSIPIQ
jgi:hypothetical protein